MAQRVGVSGRTYEKLRAVNEKGSEKLKAKVDAGVVSADAAYLIIKEHKTKIDQNELIERAGDSVRSIVKELKKDQAARRVKEREKTAKKAARASGALDGEKYKLIIGDLELRLAEHSNGHWSESELWDNLRSLIHEMASDEI